MISIVRRSSTLAQNLVKESSKSVKLHVFEKPPVSNLDELNQYLLNNIIYNNEGLILLNKPYGLRKESTEYLSQSKKKLVTKNPVVDKLEHLSFTSILPALNEELHLKELHLIKVPERYTSGVSVLATAKAARGVEKGLPQPSQLGFTYLAICFGIPMKLSDRCKLGLTLKEKNGMRKAVFVEKFSKTSLKQQLVVPVRMNYTTLATNDSLKVSLVRIQNNRNKWHAIRAFCGLRLLAPVLGDSLYGSCVRTVCGRAMPVDPLSLVANFPCKLPAKILSALDLKPENKTIIPSLLHLSGVNLEKFEPKKIFVAKPPDHFLWTCKKLNLTVPEVYLENGLVEESNYFEESSKTHPKTNS